mmetsp:Transcript_37959/g.77892  ORF Transcript_37959/g.77892 Transcript_37959/m.77892 type:complete len:222 (+) Transcript_37959:2602-3267(+)
MFFVDLPITAANPRGCLVSVTLCCATPRAKSSRTLLSASPASFRLISSSLMSSMLSPSMRRRRSPPFGLPPKPEYSSNTPSTINSPTVFFHLTPTVASPILSVNVLSTTKRTSRVSKNLSCTVLFAGPRSRPATSSSVADVTSWSPTAMIWCPTSTAHDRSAAPPATKDFTTSTRPPRDVWKTIPTPPSSMVHDPAALRLSQETPPAVSKGSLGCFESDGP